MNEPLEILLVLDVNATVSREEVRGALPDRRAELWRRSLRDGLRESGFDVDAAVQPPFDWQTLGEVVAGMAAEARAAMDAADGRRVEIFVTGKAPLPLFLLMGNTLQKFSGSQHVINARRGGPIESFPMADASAPRRLLSVRGLEKASATTGRVVVFVSTIGAPVPEDAIAELLEDNAESLGAIVEVRSEEPLDVSPETMPSIAHQIAAELSCIPSFFPRARGIAVLPAGPAQLAFAVGRALNPNVVKDVWVASFAAPKYELALRLPFGPRRPRSVAGGPADELARRRVFDAIVEGIVDLRQKIDEVDFPEHIPLGRRKAWIQFLRDLRMPREAENEGFDLGIVVRRLILGRGLLDSLRAGTSSAEWGRFGRLLLLHELFHDGQNLRTTNYSGVGRAAVVLEETDFYADAFALSVLVAHEIRRGGPDAEERAGDVATSWIETAIAGIETFDRFEQDPARIERLYERRLRRYLIWHMQRARAKTVRDRTHIDELFRGRLVVELAPLPGRLDASFDKLVTGSFPDRTELFAALDGRMARRGPGPGFSPAGLVDAVRTFERAPIDDAMRVMVEEHRSVLVSWSEDP